MAQKIRPAHIFENTKEKYRRFVVIWINKDHNLNNLTCNYGIPSIQYNENPFSDSYKIILGTDMLKSIGHGPM